MRTEPWAILLALLTLLALALRNAPLLLLASLLLLTLLASVWWARRALRAVQLDHRFAPTRLFPGETTELTVQVTNAKLLPLPWLRLDLGLPAGLEPVGPVQRVVTVLDRWQYRRVTSLGPFERVTWRLPLRARRRGYYPLGPAALESGDPLGFYPERLDLDPGGALVVYPTIRAPGAIGLPARFPFGLRSRASFDPPDPLNVVGARDYQPGDPFRQIDWKATARHARLQTRLLRPTTQHALMLVADVQTARQAWEGIDPGLLEAVCSVAAGLADQAARQRWAVGLAANTLVPRLEADAVLLPSASPAALERVLELLAKLAPLALLPSAELVRRLGPRLPRGSTVIAVSGIVTPELIAALATLHRQGHRPALVSLDPDPPPAPALLPVFPVDRAALGLEGHPSASSCALGTGSPSGLRAAWGARTPLEPPEAERRWARPAEDGADA